MQEMAEQLARAKLELGMCICNSSTDPKHALTMLLYGTPPTHVWLDAL